MSLNGSLQPIKGVLPIAINARKEGFEGFILPKQNAREAAVVDNLKVYGAENIREVIDFLNGEENMEQVVVDTRAEFYAQIINNPLDFSDVKGQENVKRALEIAASGGHNIIMICTVLLNYFSSCSLNQYSFQIWKIFINDINEDFLYFLYFYKL